MTVAAGTVALNIIYEETLLYRKVESSFKKHTVFKTRVQKPYPIHDQMAKIDTLFPIKTAEKPYPSGPHISIREYPPTPSTDENVENVGNGQGSLMS